MLSRIQREKRHSGGERMTNETGIMVILSCSLVVFQECSVVKTIVEQCINTAKTHVEYMRQRCGVSRRLTESLAKHLFDTVNSLGIPVVPSAKSHLSHVAVNVDGLEFETSFQPNRFYLSVVLDWFLRRENLNCAHEKLVREYSRGLNRYLVSVYMRQFNGTMPYRGDVPFMKSVALSLMVGSSDQFFPVLPKREKLIVTNEFGLVGKSRDTERVRRKYRLNCGLEFFGSNDLPEIWHETQNWHMISKNMYGIMTFSRSQSFCLPRLTAKMAVSRRIATELGGVSQSFQDDWGFVEQANDDGFPFTAYMAMRELSPIKRKVLETILNDEFATNKQRADFIGMPLRSWEAIKKFLVEDMNEWYAQFDDADLS